MRFRSWACEHLAQYKVEVLGVQEDGLFHYCGRDIPMSHILPINYRKMNILERYRSRFFSSDFAKVRLHRFFHHLNSSQALCINLFYPLIAEHALGLFREFLGIKTEVDSRPFFEKKSEIEIAARRTSFDFYIQGASASNIFVEVKYTEVGFGQGRNDDEHRDKFDKTYLPLVEKSLFLVRRCQEKEFFLKHYQILRNLIHISDSDYVVFLLPAANCVVHKEAIWARDQMLTEAGRARLKIVFLEKFVSFLENRCSDSPLGGYYKAFRTKYLST